ncbi:SDR family NAD(P)-dependent oxidoreductase [Winogradskyella sp.]|uniref:SDR family NAD(P)-dependent oxidoreductase n=1 Tax=Winogradskyella sp. TaxID=1883156 RepID=UPI00261536C7|nr:SDR family NAD(P)-dependent oxidoreductase [Winogradskyella sp.]
MKTDKIALITEAGNGLSQKFAEILSYQNYSVIIAAKGESYNKLNRTNLGDIKLLNVDLTNSSELIKLYSYLKTQYGKLDVLINNAEIANGFGQKITELNINDVKTLYDNNFFSVINTIKILFGLLNKSESATIVNITSAMGNIDKMSDKNFCYKDYKMTAYSTAKSSLNMLTTILDKEFELHNIKVKSFDPVRISNCTHNSVDICEGVEKELIGLLQIEEPIL